jgi:hypothetical protein
VRVPPRALAAVVLTCAVAALAVVQPVRSTAPSPFRQSSFDTDPHWDGLQNQPAGGRLNCVGRDFDFGWLPPSRSSPAGAIGGKLARATAVRAYYAKVLDAPQSLADTLSASGTIRIDKSGHGGLLFGWFNSVTSYDWRTPDFLGMRLDGKRLYLEYGTENTFSAFAGPVSVGSTKDVSWTLTYLPDGGTTGTGVLRLVIAKAIELSIRPEHRLDGATFDRFGLLNSQVDGPDMTASFSKLTLDGQPISLLTSPGWDASNNESDERDCVLNGQQNFGYSAGTQFAGGAPGEIGGVVWRAERKKSYYGDPIDPVGFGDLLYAEGDIDVEAASSDADVFLGWFAAAGTGNDLPANTVAFDIGGPSEWGTRVFPVYRSSGAPSGTFAPLAQFDRFEAAPLLSPKHHVRHFWMCYRPPNPGFTAGSLSVGLTDPQGVLPDSRVGIKVKTDAETRGAVLDRFGLRTLGRGGHSLTVYLDNVRYTSGPGDSGPTDRCA